MYCASITCLSLWERWPSVARTERANNDYTKRQHPIKKCPTASQGDDTPRTYALVSFSPQTSSKNLQTADYRQIHRGFLLCFGQKVYKTLSVTCGDSSPKGRAKGLHPLHSMLHEKWSVSVSIRSIDCFMNTHLTHRGCFLYKPPRFML